MGILHLWQLVGDGETRSIAEWSSDHFKATGRPLRIAVDEANWRYNSLSDAQDAMIKRNSAGSNVREKDILERISILLTLNVQLVFVFDGDNKGAKKGGSVKMVHQEKVHLLKQMLDHLGVPRLQAPGDAEAECVRLQQLGTVDAVWSDDSDVFMFGCHTLVCFHREEVVKNKKVTYPKSKDTVDVFDLKTVQERTGLSQKGILLFALLVGNDFDRRGLVNCGKQMALKLARQESLATDLASMSTEQEIRIWRRNLAAAIYKINPSFDRTKLKDFPQSTVLTACKRPKVSADAVLSPSTFERKGWFSSFQLDPTQMASLFDFFINHFHSTRNVNFPAHYIVPLAINHRLRCTASEQKSTNDDIALKLVTKRGQELTTIVRVQDPLLILHELGHVCGKKFIRKKGEESLVFEPIEFELLNCVLEHGFSETARTAKREEDRKKSKASKKGAHESQQADAKKPAKTLQAHAQAAPKPKLSARIDLIPQRKRKALDAEDSNDRNQPRARKERSGKVDGKEEAKSETTKPTSAFRTNDLSFEVDENEEPNDWEIEDDSERPERSGTSLDLTSLLRTSNDTRKPKEQPFWVSQRSNSRADVSDEDDLPELQDLVGRTKVPI